LAGTFTGIGAAGLCIGMTSHPVGLCFAIGATVGVLVCAAWVAVSR